MAIMKANQKQDKGQSTTTNNPGTIILNKLSTAGWRVDGQQATHKSDITVTLSDKTAKMLHPDGSSKMVSFDIATPASILKWVSDTLKTGKIAAHVEQNTAPPRVGKKSVPTKKGKAAQTADPDPLASNSAPEPREESTGKAPERPTTAAKGKGKTATASAKKTSKKAPQKKAAPAAPQRPAAPQGTPVFDELNTAVVETESAEKNIEGIWGPMAKKYNFSVVPVIAALHAENKWPDKMGKNGQPINKDGFTVPAGYKSVYQAERESGLQGVGHLINVASRMFSKYNPDKEENASKGNRQGETKQQRTIKALSTDEILTKLSDLFASLSPEDRRSWLDSDQNVISTLKEMQNGGNIQRNA